MDELLKQCLCFKKENKTFKARAVFETIFQNNFHSIPALAHLAQIFKRHQMFDEALRCRRRIMNLVPNDPAAVARYLEQLAELTTHDTTRLVSKLHGLSAKQDDRHGPLCEVAGDVILNMALSYPDQLVAAAHRAYRKAAALGSHTAAFKLAMALRSLGQYDESDQLFKESMRIMLEKKMINRMTVVQRLLDLKKGASYLEVGVFRGAAFLRIAADRKLAVDPQFFIPGGHGTQKGEEYYNLGSDDFFATQKDVFPQGGFDVILIDGDHTYKQSLRDTLNALEHLQEDGVLVVHDCYLLGGCAAWKTIVHLRARVPGVRVFVLDTDCGVGIIVKGLSEDSLNFTEDEIKNLKDEDFEKNKVSFLDLRPKSYFEEFIAERERSREDRVSSQKKSGLSV